MSRLPIGRISLKRSIHEYLEKRAHDCKREIPTVIEEILECWIAQEKSRVRLKSTRMEGEENVIEEIGSGEVGDDTYTCKGVKY